MPRARRTTTRTTRTTRTTAQATPKKAAPPTPANVPVKNATPFVELSYAHKSDDTYGGSAVDSTLRIFHTGANEVTLVNGSGRRAAKSTFHVDKLIALVGAAVALPVGQPDS